MVAKTDNNHFEFAQHHHLGDSISIGDHLQYESSHEKCRRKHIGRFNGRVYAEQCVRHIEYRN